MDDLSRNGALLGMGIKTTSAPNVRARNGCSPVSLLTASAARSIARTCLIWPSGCLTATYESFLIASRIARDFLAISSLSPGEYWSSETKLISDGKLIEDQRAVTIRQLLQQFIQRFIGQNASPILQHLSRPCKILLFGQPLRDE